jgi:hypothetical protein
MKEKSLITLVWELIKRPPMALIILGVCLVLLSAFGRYQDYKITDIYWRVGVAVLGLLLVASGLFLLSKEKSLAQESEIPVVEEVSPLPGEPPPLTSDRQISSREAKVLHEILAITENYIKEVCQALEPNALEDFLDQKALPSANRRWEWWEKAIATGQGPRAFPLTFLNKHKAIQLLTLSSQLTDVVSHSGQISTLVQEIHSQSDGFHTITAHRQQEYRLTYLRNHIQKIIR